MFGQNARVDTHARHCLGQLRRGESVDFLPGQNLVRRTGEPQVGSNRSGRQRMVSGDHDGLDAGSAATSDCQLGLFARGIGHPDQAGKDQP